MKNFIPTIDLEILIPNECYQNLYKKYTQKHRFYHTWGHVLSMLDKAKEIGIKLTEAQYLAILYHDSIYDIGSKKNEDDSVTFMLEQLNKANISDIIVLDAARMIRATALHLQDQDVNSETAIVLDLDLHTMAEDSYVENMINIRKEYVQKVYEYSSWISGRINFLRSMLDRKTIFYTDYFDEDCARYNLNFELQVLKCQI